ncbi:hypothetical protein CHCC20335_1520 [Bacillus paralicheniformis]|nr:hypothetical protein CHCC20335_1520 [Bacillus paralicheniformis]
MSQKSTKFKKAVGRSGGLFQWLPLKSKKEAGHFSDESHVF